MSSAICFNLDQSNTLSSGNGLSWSLLSMSKSFPITEKGNFIFGANSSDEKTFWSPVLELSAQNPSETSGSVFTNRSQECS